MHGMEKYNFVQGSVDIPDTNILPPASRVGHTQRKQAIQHVSDMAEEGYLKHDEATQRIRHLEDAVTSTEVKHLISDLPPYVAPFVHTVKHGYFRDWDFSKQKYFTPVCSAGIISSFVLAIIPLVVLNTEHVLNTGWGAGVGYTSLLLGICGIFAFIATLIYMYDQHG